MNGITLELGEYDEDEGLAFSMPIESCPDCGSSKMTEAGHHVCDAIFGDLRCEERQIAKLRDSLEATERELADAKGYCKKCGWDAIDPRCPLAHPSPCPGRVMSPSIAASETPLPADTTSASPPRTHER